MEPQKTTEPLKTALDRSLRTGDVPSALAAAKLWAETSQTAPRDTAIEIAKCVGTVYRDLVAEPVHRFIEQIEATIPGEVGTTVSKAVGRLINITVSWEGKLRACHEERLARELRDFVRNKQFPQALENVAELLKLTQAEQAGDRADAVHRRVVYVGNVLGTCLNHPREAEAVVDQVARSAESLGITPAMAADMKKARADRAQAMMGANLDNLENQWITTLKQTQVEILQAMPGKNLMGDPEEEELRNIGDIFRSILRVPFWRRDLGLLTDATLVLVDFTPKELALAAKSSGVEGRSYNELGFRAKKTVGMVFMEIGKNAAFAKGYQDWATPKFESSPHATAMVEFMGALRCEAYSPLFLQMWNNKNLAPLRAELSTALANLASPESAMLLLEELRAQLSTNVFTKRALDAGDVRRARKVLESLGRVMKSPRTPDALRMQILHRVTELIPRDQTQIALAAVMEVLSSKPDALTKEQRHWAIATLVESLWVQDQSTDMHKGAERQTTILGSREPLAMGLIRLARNDIDFLLSELLKRASRYSGAYMAVAEVLQQLKDPRAIPLLAMMTRNALLFDAGSISTYQKETYWDSTAQQRKALGKDQVVSPLVFAIGTIGGPEARTALEDINAAIQGNRTHAALNETLTYIGKFLGPQIGGASTGSLPPPPPPAPGGVTPPTTGQPAPAAKVPSADPAEVKELVKAVSGSYLLTSASKRAQAKITALARLGQVTPLEALDAVLDNLVDKDPMVASAAITTAAEYAAPGKPAALVSEAMDRVLAALEHRDASVRVAAVKVLKAMDPHRNDIKKRLQDFARLVDRSDLRLTLSKLLGDEMPGPTGALPAPPPPQPDGTGPADSPADGKAAQAAASKSSLDLKREYMQARQRWVAGGKKGPPPEAPPGVTF